MLSEHTIWTFCVLKINIITVWLRTMNTWNMSGMLFLSNYACEIPSTNQSVYCYSHDLPSFLLLSCSKVQNVCVKLSNNWVNEIQIGNLKQNYGKTFFFSNQRNLLFTLQHHFKQNLTFLILLILIKPN